jgi:hypothetical protein
MYWKSIDDDEEWHMIIRDYNKRHRQQISK